MAGTSRMDFTPAETTVMAVDAERGEVGRLVERVAGTPVHAPEPAGGEHVDADQRRQLGGGRHRGGAVTTTGHDHGHVADAGLDDVVGTGHDGERIVIEPDPHDAVDDGDGGRHGTLRPHHALDLVGDVDVGRAGQPVGDDRGFQRHDGTSRAQRVGHLGGDLHATGQVVEHQAGHRASLADDLTRVRRAPPRGPRPAHRPCGVLPRR